MKTRPLSYIGGFSIAMKTYYIDGGCSANNQTDQTKRVMVSVVTNDLGDVELECEYVGFGSNNIAEFMTLRSAIDIAIAEQYDSVKILTDSKNNIAWFNKKGHKFKKINDPILVSEIKQDIDKSKEEIEIELEWIPRDDNLAGHVIEEKHSL